MTAKKHNKMTTKGIRIDPPPKENSREPLFRVVYSIDVNAKDAHRAAENAYKIMSDCNSMLPVLDVIDSKGTKKRIDLADHRPGRQRHKNMDDLGAVAKHSGSQEHSMFTKITVGFVAQTFKKNPEGKFVCTAQEFIAGDQCDYEDAEGKPTEPPDYEYQPYNMTL